MWSCPRPNILLWQWCHWSFLQIKLEESIYFCSLHDSPDLGGCVCPRRSQTSPCLSQCSSPPKLLSRLRSHLQISQKSSRNGICLDHHRPAWLGGRDGRPSEIQWPDIPGQHQYVGKLFPRHLKLYISQRSIFQVIWSVRRATVTGCFLACLSDPDPRCLLMMMCMLLFKMVLMFPAFTSKLYYRLYTGMKIWTFFMAATMLLQIVMNLDWLDNLL